MQACTKYVDGVQPIRWSMDKEWYCIKDVIGGTLAMCLWNLVMSLGRFHPSLLRILVHALGHKEWRTRKYE